jgi:hypothetical protein
MNRETLRQWSTRPRRNLKAGKAALYLSQDLRRPNSLL